MFKDLRTGTKLLILCGLFIISIGVTTYSLVSEKNLAIDFARKELIGNRHLADLRRLYAAVLLSDLGDGNPAYSIDRLIETFSSPDSPIAGLLQTGRLEQALVVKLREYQARRAANENAAALIPDVLGRVSALALRVGEESNLTLDPDLDTYYLQDTIVGRLPALLGQFGEARSLFRDGSATPETLYERKVRILVLDGLVRSTMNDIRRNLVSAYRGNADGSLRPVIEDPFTTMATSATVFLRDLNMSTTGDGAQILDAPGLARDYTSAVGTAIMAWEIAGKELDRLLQQRIEGLQGKMLRSLMIVAALTGLSIIIAFMTHRYIVRPLKRLEAIARTVRETKNYDLRSDQKSQDEIGQLAIAFNDMLSELAAARERELSDQTEFARVARLTAMGTMTASIAHEINQPLAAIVANSSAGLRWLARSPPDLDEVRIALTNIVGDGHRASEVIESIRHVFRRGARDRTPVGVNAVVRDAVDLAESELRSKRVSVQTELAEDLPPVLADRVQLQQVLLNLIRNAVEAMASITDRRRVLHVKTEHRGNTSILVTVEDSGIGLDSNNVTRIFEAFYTTKSDGMGMGLAICRSIVEAHGGRLWASPAAAHGSIFHMELPRSRDDGA